MLPGSRGHPLWLSGKTSALHAGAAGEQETAVRSLGQEDPLEEGLDLRSRELQAEGIESAKALGQECQWCFRRRKEEELG